MAPFQKCWISATLKFHLKLLQIDISQTCNQLRFETGKKHTRSTCCELRFAIAAQNMRACTRKSYGFLCHKGVSVPVLSATGR